MDDRRACTAAQSATHISMAAAEESAAAEDGRRRRRRRGQAEERRAVRGVLWCSPATRSDCACALWEPVR